MPLLYLIQLVIFLILLSLSAVGYTATVSSGSNTIKLALLDSFYNEMPLIPETSTYEKAYFAGVETANDEAKKYGITIQYKPFIYDVGPLDVLKEVPKVKAWGADVVIGPSASDQCLLLGNSFPNTMILSSYASDINLKKLPKTFYSTFLSDDQIMDLLSRFIKERFPKKNLYIIEQVDCKQCVDAGALFIDSYKKISPNPNIHFLEEKIVGDINSIDSKNLMQHHENDVTLVFSGTYYSYVSFVHHIASAFPKQQLIFFSDQDNWSNEVDGNTYKPDLTFEAYRIGPILFDQSSSVFRKFVNSYYHIYHEKPKDAISYLTYYSVMSVIEALHQFPDPNKNDAMREKIRYSYITALKKYPNWFRPENFAIYQLTSKGEVLIKRLPGPT